MQTDPLFSAASVAVGRASLWESSTGWPQHRAASFYTPLMPRLLVCEVVMMVQGAPGVVVKVTEMGSVNFEQCAPHKMQIW